MHSLKDLRKNFNIYKKKLSDRNFDLKFDLFEKLDKDNRKLISEKEKLEQEKKILSKSKDKLNSLNGLNNWLYSLPFKFFGYNTF